MYPSSSPSYIIIFRVLFFICVSSLRVYRVLASGWSSNSKYALLGALRSIAQTISYEVRMSLIILGSLVILVNLDFCELHNNFSMAVFFICFPLFIVWFCTILAETNRTPFDFSEGESELVSGFNTEYRRGTFALIFIAEYLNILIIRLLSSILFFSLGGGWLLNDLITTFFTLFLSFMFIWVRGALPRMRYDKLISLTWKGFLPYSLCVIIIIISIFFLF
jgi:NADH-ubiquinone oxidoreductase chain 1